MGADRTWLVNISIDFVIALIISSVFVFLFVYNFSAIVKGILDVFQMWETMILTTWYGPVVAFGVVFFTAWMFYLTIWITTGSCFFSGGLDD